LGAWVGRQHYQPRAGWLAMTWLLRVAVRLAPLRKLKARRCELLLEKQGVLFERQHLRIKAFEVGDGYLLAVGHNNEKRINAQLDVINDEIGRRAK
jgi:hypothetical protein